VAKGKAVSSLLHRDYIAGILEIVQELNSRKGGIVVSVQEHHCWTGGEKVPGSQPFLSTFHLYVLIVVCTFLLIQHDLRIAAEQEFVYLAKSFLEGHLYFTASPGVWDDTSYYHGHYYWPLGPLPAIILLPFVALFGPAVRQGYFLSLFNLINLLLVQKIGRKITQNRISSLWLSFAYVFSTEYLNVARGPWSSYFAQVVATSFILLALYEFFHRKRWWLIGLYVALGVTTRINIIIAGVFFVLSIMVERENKSQKIKYLLRFSLPVVVSIVLLMAYNFFRFDNVLESGYGLQLVHDKLAANRGYGLWSPVHFPANFYYCFLRGPVGVFIPGTKVLTYPYLRADGWGMSMLFTSPIFLWLVKAPWKSTAVRLSALTCILMFTAFSGYYGIGFYQYGYRYALDLYPFLFLVLAYAARGEFSFPMKLIALLSFVFNWYLISFMME
jgi:hypothetical protein